MSKEPAKGVRRKRTKAHAEGTSYPIPEMNLGPRERVMYGVIATAREQATGRMWTLHRVGTSNNAMREIAAELDAAPGDWKVISISMPQSIYRDFQGSRVSFDGNRSSLDRSVSDPRSNEVGALRRIGRMDLLEPISKLPRTAAA